MTEQEYIDLSDLQTARIIITLLRDNITPEVSTVIKPEECKMVKQIVSKWYDELHKVTKITEVNAPSKIFEAPLTLSPTLQVKGNEVTATTITAYTATSLLRYAKKIIQIDENTATTELRLQQMWQGADGSQKWEWVPEVEEGTSTANDLDNPTEFTVRRLKETCPV